MSPLTLLEFFSAHDARATWIFFVRLNIKCNKIEEPSQPDAIKMTAGNHYLIKEIEDVSIRNTVQLLKQHYIKSCRFWIICEMKMDSILNNSFKFLTFCSHKKFHIK